jgi:hypothetical protein
MRETRKNKHMIRNSEGRNQQDRQGMQFSTRNARCEEGRSHDDQPVREQGNYGHKPLGLMRHHHHHGPRPKGLMQQRFHRQAMHQHPQRRHRDASRTAHSLIHEIRALEQMSFRMLRRLKALDHQLRAIAVRQE